MAYNMVLCTQVPGSRSAASVLDHKEPSNLNNSVNQEHGLAHTRRRGMGGI